MSDSPYARLGIAIARAHVAQVRAEVSIEEAERYQREMLQALEDFYTGTDKEGAALLEQPAPMSHNGR